MATDRITTHRVRQMKGKTPIAALTAYDVVTARLLDEAGIPLLLVGDSLAMAVLGYEDTLPVTMEQMLHHTRAVVRGAARAMVVADMPFLSFQVSVEEGLRNAGRFLKEGGADAVKIEGGAFRAPLIRALVENGIPVMGHIGLTPQSVHAMGGYRVQGRSEESAAQLKEDAQAVQEAGCFVLVLEGVPAPLAKEITEAVDIPTIGIGAGPDTDGQVLVIHDLLGLSGEFRPKFVKQYAALGEAITEAVQTYRDEVEHRVFPGPEHTYS